MNGEDGECRNFAACELVYMGVPGAYIRRRFGRNKKKKTNSVPSLLLI